MIRVIYTTDTLEVFTVLNATGTTYYPINCDQIEDTIENIISTAESVGILDTSLIEDFLNSI